MDRPRPRFPPPHNSDRRFWLQLGAAAVALVVVPALLHLVVSYDVESYLHRGVGAAFGLGLLLGIPGTVLTWLLGGRFFFPVPISIAGISLMLGSALADLGLLLGHEIGGPN